MGKLTLTLAAAALILGSVALSANAQIARRFERAERAGAERDDHPQDGVRRLRPLVPAGNAPGLRPRPLLVRSLLGSS